MGGKGKRRRERNYRAAHGGSSRLPPPPNPSTVDALPSKLRQLISLTSGTGGKVVVDIQKRNKRVPDVDNDKDSEFSYVIGDIILPLKLVSMSGMEKGKSKKDHLNDESKVKLSRSGDGHEDGEEEVNEDEDMLSKDDNDTSKKRKAKRKRNQVNDLRFQEEVLGVGSKRRERKKKYLEERKNRHKKAKREEHLEFPGHEKVKFGDIVQAPPKFVKIPKAFKTGEDASKERLRLKAVEAYRQRKGWNSRPGVHLPPPVTMSPSD